MTTYFHVFRFNYPETTEADIIINIIIIIIIIIIIKGDEGQTPVRV